MVQNMTAKYKIESEWKQTLLGNAPHIYLIEIKTGKVLHDVHNPKQWTKYTWEYDDYDEAWGAFAELANIKS